MPAIVPLIAPLASNPATIALAAVALGGALVYYGVQLGIDSQK